MESDDELDCPLCMEEFDIADRNFKPCYCGYQICRFCWHHIRENLNGRCPACRREYTEEMAQFKPVSADELQRIKKEKKEKEKQQKDMESANRRHLSNMRVVQKNLVYIIGLHPKLATEEIVRSNDYFGQFGKISKVVINKKPTLPPSQISINSALPSAAVYVTYYRKEDAAKAIAAVDGSLIADRVVRASYGTTKYCTYYLRNMTCPNPNCLYLHEQGDDIDTISKEELANSKHHMRDMLTEDDKYEGVSSKPYPTASSSSTTTTATTTAAAAHGHTPAVSSSSTTAAQAHSHQPRPLLSSEDFPAVSASLKGSHKATASSNAATDDSALPATASWAKMGASNGSTPSTPIMTVSDAFGPSLSDAVAAAQQKAQFPPMPKRKSEKKKRKEQQQKAAAAAATISEASSVVSEPTGSQMMMTSAHNEDDQQQDRDNKKDTQNQKKEKTKNKKSPSIFEQGLTGFVLGQAYREVFPMLDPEVLLQQQQEEYYDEDMSSSEYSSDTLSVGISALKLDDENIKEENDIQQQVLLEPSAAQRNLEAIQSASISSSTIPSVLDYLTYSTPTPKYTGLFNPFAHMSMLTSNNAVASFFNVAAATPPAATNTTTTTNPAAVAANLDSPVRRHSRFNFAQA
ncbi:hypothetical protein BDF20DRAFT_839609 [Mycotypha africana]|uniref:uncharacterized protein n=1 Tax=Mycotypha africana TaxID=64632 RepID=UPI00230090F4|nr:uncharacterized protein BDF20DRAFT_839609 [Mycotypha africana]KAI8968508.1 hypothetical protein BDF20DRAFT_839609 [Mycotypha africana]